MVIDRRIASRIIGRAFTCWLVLILMISFLPEPPAVLGASAPGLDSGLSRGAAESAANKFRQIQDSSASGQSFGSIRFSEVELNSYFQYEMVSEFPPGFSKVRLKLQPGRPHGSAEVDFDKLKGSFKTPPNLIVDYFLRGVHTLGVDGTLSGSHGAGQFHLETVTLDDIAVPQIVVDFLIDHYLKARYPGVAVDRPFSLPSSIDKLIVEAGNVVVVGHPIVSGR